MRILPGRLALVPLLLAAVTAGGVAALGVAPGPAARPAAVTRAPRLPRSALEGREAPPFRLTAAQGPTGLVGVAAGAGRPVVLNFFASWCGPCRQELPVLAAAWRASHGRVRFLGVAVDDPRGAALQLARSAGVGYPLGLDPRGRLARRYGLLGLPSTVLVGPGGTVEAVHTGPVDPAWLRRGVARLERR